MYRFHRCCFATIRRSLGRVFMAAALVSAATLAVSANAYTTRPLMVASQERLSLPQAAEKLRSKVGGRVLGAKVIEREGRTLYEIKVLLKPGKIKVYWLDPMSGAIL